MNCNEAFNKLHENVTKKVEECKYDMPKKQRKKNEWISQECIKLGREVNRLKKKFLRITMNYLRRGRMCLVSNFMGFFGGKNLFQKTFEKA